MIAQQIQEKHSINFNTFLLEILSMLRIEEIIFNFIRGIWFNIYN